MLLAQARDLAAYNRWMNRRIYASCETLSDAQRKQDCGAFFKSIHGSLNHLLVGDKIWLGRFFDKPFSVPGLDHELHSCFHSLTQDREKTDQLIIEWANQLTQETLAGDLNYTSMVNPEPRKLEMWLAVTHFFNHQTHHRGQISTLLSQFGVEVGVTDLVWMPEVMERNRI